MNARRRVADRRPAQRSARRTYSPTSGSRHRLKRPAERPPDPGGEGGALPISRRLRRLPSNYPIIPLDLVLKSWSQAPQLNITPIGRTAKRAHLRCTARTGPRSRTAAGLIGLSFRTDLQHQEMPGSYRCADRRSGPVSQVAVIRSWMLHKRFVSRQGPPRERGGPWHHLMFRSRSKTDTRELTCVQQRSNRCMKVCPTPKLRGGLPPATRMRSAWSCGATPCIGRRGDLRPLPRLPCACLRPHRPADLSRAVPTSCIACRLCTISPTTG